MLNYMHPEFVGAEDRSENYDAECGSLLTATPAPIVTAGPAPVRIYGNTRPRFVAADRRFVGSPVTRGEFTYRDVADDRGRVLYTQVTDSTGALVGPTA